MVRIISACSALVMVLCLFGMPVFSKTPDDFTVGPIKDPAMDAGCSLNARGTDWQTPPIFTDNAGGPPMMNINGENVLLKRVDDLNWKTPEYTGENLHVRVVYGYGKEGEGGVTYKRAKIIVTYRGIRKTVKVEGSCGC